MKRSVMISRVAVLHAPAQLQAVASAAIASGKVSASDAQAADAFISNARPNQANLVDIGLVMRLCNAIGQK
jgi:hypothetical protein